MGPMGPRCENYNSNVRGHRGEENKVVEADLWDSDWNEVCNRSYNNIIIVMIHGRVVLWKTE